MMEEIQLPNIPDEEFQALRCIVNHARNTPRCSLANARAHVLAQGFSQESVDAAVKFWAKYEGSKL